MYSIASRRKCSGRSPPHRRIRRTQCANEVEFPHFAQRRVRVVITCRLKTACTRPLADAQERMVITRWLEKAGLRLLALTAPRSCFH